MRDRKTLLYLTASGLTPEEKAGLGDMGLNICDKCGQVEISEKLNWLDNEEMLEIEKVRQHFVETGNVALCDYCFDNLTLKYYLQDNDEVTADGAVARFQKQNDNDTGHMNFDSWGECTYYHDGLEIEFDKEGRAYTEYKEE